MQTILRQFKNTVGEDNVIVVTKFKTSALYVMKII